MTVADFYAEFMTAAAPLGVDVRSGPCRANREAVPFDQDRGHAQYDPVYAQKFWRALVQSTRVMNEFRTPLYRQGQPGSFLLGQFRSRGDALFRTDGAAAERASRRSRRLGHGGSLLARISSCGSGRAMAAWLPGLLRLCLSGAGRLWSIRYIPAEASYNKELGQFILPYDAVRKACDPDALLLGFLQETYEAAADLAKWDRNALERH